MIRIVTLRKNINCFTILGNVKQLMKMDTNLEKKCLSLLVRSHHVDSSEHLQTGMFHGSLIPVVVLVTFLCIF